MSGKNRLQGGVAKHANRLLPKVDALFKERGISYCLDGGTLLGVIREAVSYTHLTLPTKA